MVNIKITYAYFSCFITFCQALPKECFSHGKFDFAVAAIPSRKARPRLTKRLDHTMQIMPDIIESHSPRCIKPVRSLMDVRVVVD